MAESLKIGIAGLGTVGIGVVKMLEQNRDLLTSRAGRSLDLVAVNAREKNKNRGHDLGAYQWADTPQDLAGMDHLDVIVELIGGEDGAALELCEAALKNSKHVVTANKALMAHHGAKLAVLAEANNVSLAYEAAVAGGIPIIKAMREGFAGNNIHAVYGILNGTCNYILSEMRNSGRDFEEVLKEAQELGYAEADPSFDVDGVDAGHKLCLLTALAFGTKPEFDSLEMTGIRHINATDIAYASELGYKIKLLGIARRYDEGIMQVLEPCLVPCDSSLGSVEGVFNAVHVEGDFVDTGYLVGRGAGEGPTASAVLSDIVDIARGYNAPTFGVPAKDLTPPQWVDMGATMNCYYIRLNVIDQPGVLADVSSILRDNDVSIEAFLQRGRDPGQAVPLIMTTHETRHENMTRACAAMEKLGSILDKPCLIPIENIE
ncbi:MAG: homoserine dehydrogenase [Alphaproteobacteria bacterium]